MSARPAAVIVLVAMALSALSACASEGAESEAAGAFVSYERVWPDGLTESTEVYADGRVVMRHDDRLERFTIPAGDVARLQAALAEPIASGDPQDELERTLTLADGVVVAAPLPDPGSVTELLDRLTGRHSLADPEATEAATGPTAPEDDGHDREDTSG